MDSHVLWKSRWLDYFSPSTNAFSRRVPIAGRNAITSSTTATARSSADSGRSMNVEKRPWEMISACRAGPAKGANDSEESGMDADLDRMSREQLLEEVKKLRNGIRAHRDSKLHELCWHHPALWGLLPEKTDPVPVVPTWPEFIRGCVRYRQCLDMQAPGAPRSSEPYEE